jgi:hypothetical protein
MASVLRRADLPSAAAQRLVVAAGLGGFVVCSVAFLGPGSSSAYGVLSAPLFVYVALAGFLVPALVEVLRLARVPVPGPPFDLTWSLFELDVALVATVAIGLLVLTGEDSKLGLVAGIVASLGLLVGARRVA